MLLAQRILLCLCLLGIGTPVLESKAANPCGHADNGEYFFCNPFNYDLDVHVTLLSNRWYHDHSFFPATNSSWATPKNRPAENGKGNYTNIPINYRVDESEFYFTIPADTVANGMYKVGFDMGGSTYTDTGGPVIAAGLYLITFEAATTVSFYLDTRDADKNHVPYFCGGNSYSVADDFFFYPESNGNITVWHAYMNSCNTNSLTYGGSTTLTLWDISKKSVGENISQPNQTYHFDIPYTVGVKHMNGSSVSSYIYTSYPFQSSTSVPHSSTMKADQIRYFRPAWSATYNGNSIDYTIYSHNQGSSGNVSNSSYSSNFGPVVVQLSAPSSTNPDSYFYNTSLPVTITFKYGWLDPYRVSTTNDVLGIQGSNIFHVGQPIRFSYQLTDASPVTIQVFNALGSEVKRVSYLSQSPGNHSYDIPTDELAAGTYFVRHLTRSTSSTKSVTIIR